MLVVQSRQMELNLRGVEIKALVSKALVLLLVALMCLAGLIGRASAMENPIKLIISDEGQDVLDVGIGWNDILTFGDRWPIYLGNRSSWSSAPPEQHDFTSGDWERFFDLLEWSGCHWVRHGMQISDWEPNNDNSNPLETNWEALDFASNQMKRHYLILDQYEKRGIKVLLANWGMNAKWLASNDGLHWYLSHPKSNEEFAESLAAIAYHLKRVKGYRCIWGLSLWNEPNGSWAYKGRGAHYPETFWPLYKCVDRHLRRLGIRDEILIVGPDSSNLGNLDHIPAMLKKNGPVIDVVADHDYGAFHGEPMEKSIQAYTKLRRELAGVYGRDIPMVIGEFGNYGNKAGPVDDDPSVFRGALSTVEFIIRLINAGLDGFSRWAFEIYGDKWRNFGALTGTHKSYVFFPYGPVYYPHALTARYIAPGWRVLKVEVVEGNSHSKSPLSTCALISPTGDITVLFTNHADSLIPVEILFKSSTLPKGSFNQLFVTGPIPTRIERGDDIILKHRKLLLNIQPDSITALTTRTPGDLSFPEKVALRRFSTASE